MYFYFFQDILYNFINKFSDSSRIVVEFERSLYKMVELKKKYGLITAICMVVGIVVGSGVFFKAESMLQITNGDLPVALLSWLLGGVVMVISAYTFSVMGTKFEKINGIVDYSEALVGSKYAYYVGWFMASIYYPAMTSVLAWLSARYTMNLFGIELNASETMVLAFVYLICSFALNTLSPKLAGHFQVTTTVIKLIPLVLMAVVGIIFGLKNGVLIDNLNSVVEVTTDAAGEAVYTQVPRNGVSFDLLLSGICTSVFAYEGWIIATAINSELKDAKKNLPRALVLGTFIVIAVYMLYYIGISGSIKTAELLPNGAGLAFKSIFGNIAGTILTAFIAVSCLGTLNGLTLACGRGFFSLAARNQGPRPDYLASVDKATEMPSNASIIALIFNALWLFYFYMANLSGITEGYTGKASIFLFDSSELPLICVYAFYLPVYINLMRKGKDLNVFKRFVMPLLSFAGAILFIYAAIAKHGTKNFGFLIIAFVIMSFGAFMDIFSKGKKKNAKGHKSK